MAPCGPCRRKSPRPAATTSLKGRLLHRRGAARCALGTLAIGSRPGREELPSAPIHSNAGVSLDVAALLDFVTIRTHERRLLLEDRHLTGLIEDDGHSLKARYAEVPLELFVVMPNHVHGGLGLRLE